MNNSYDNSCDSLHKALKSYGQNKSYDSSLDDNIYASCESTSFLGGLNGGIANINSTTNSLSQDNSFYCDYLMTCSDDTFISQSQEYPPYPSLSSSPGSTYNCGNILGEDGRISLAYENLKHIPKKIADKFSSDTIFLDLSYNSFRSLSFLTHFKGLHTLILDRNISLDESTLPFLPKLKILWMNNCEIQNIPKWIFRIQTQCPNLEQLSMINNPGARTLVNGGTVYENKDFHLFIQRTLTNLKYLDGVPIDHQIGNSSDSVSIQTSQEKNISRFGTRNNSFPTKSTKVNLKSFFRFKKTAQNLYTTSSSS
ncbi:hypothetical protein ACFFRR_006978 [Megaselia abdita]